MQVQAQRMVMVLAVAVALAGSGAPALAQSQIFADGFESGDLSRWSVAREQRPGSLSVNAAAAMKGTAFGLEVAAGAVAWVASQEPEREKGVFVSFFFSPDNVELLVRARAEIFRLYGPGRRHHLRLVLRQSPGGLRVGLLVRGNRGRYELIGGGLVPAGQESLIEVEWKAASTPNGTDGLATLWVNGEVEANEPSLANGRLDVRTMQLGLLGGNLRATRGSLYFDEFASFRTLAP